MPAAEKERYDADDDTAGKSRKPVGDQKTGNQPCGQFKQGGIDEYEEKAQGNDNKGN
jgi:hypothetical protein